MEECYFAEACNSTKSNTLPWLLCTFFKLYKWYKLAQCITFGINSENIILYNYQKIKNDFPAAGRPKKLNFFTSHMVTLVGLRRNFHLSYLCFLYRISEVTVSCTINIANCKNNDPQLIFTCSMSTLEKRVKYVQS